MKLAFILSASAALSAINLSAHANTFINGSFENVSNGLGEINNNTQVNGWFVLNGNNSYTFVTDAATAATGMASQYGPVGIWTTSNGGLNTLTASPNGGNFIVMDGDFPGHNEPLQQTISGLKIGRAYKVGFDYAYAQQENFYGDTKQQWRVSLGDSKIKHTKMYANPSQGYSGWSHATMTFVADAATETLKFAAYGNKPVPPFALLDGVTFSQETGAVPEPATWTMMILGVGAIGALARRRRALALAPVSIA